MVTLKAAIRKEHICVMAGRELRRLRAANGLTQQKLANKMAAWGWKRYTVDNYERSAGFRLELPVMNELLTILKARSI